MRGSQSDTLPLAHRSAQRRGDETCKCACLPFRSPTSPSRIPSHNRAVLRDGNNQQQSEPVWTGTGANGDVGVPQYWKLLKTDLSKAVWRQNQSTPNHSNNIWFNLNKFHQLGCVVVKKIRVNEILNVHPKRKSHLARRLPLLSLYDFKPRATDWCSAAAELQERTVYTNASVLSVSTGSATCNLANLTHSKRLLCLLPKWNALLTKNSPWKMLFCHWLQTGTFTAALCCRHLCDLWVWYKRNCHFSSTEQNVLGAKQVVSGCVIQHLRLTHEIWGSLVSFLLVWTAPWYLHWIHNANTTDL